MDHFVFRKHDNVGAAAAEHDSQYLDECFVDTGELEFLLDRKNPKRIVVGRTGTGKTALLHQLNRLDINVIQLSPHDLSLNFIATNKVIAFFEEAGVNLAPFYVLLWKHLLVVELIKKRYEIVDETAYKNFIQSISSIVRKRDRNKELAIDYFQNWGHKFWLTTEERIKELTSRVENSLAVNLNGTLAGIPINAEGARKLTEEQRKEVIEHGLDAVSKVQIRELEHMLIVLDENIFDDHKNPYYVTIDMLDEDWADDRIRFKLIRSLIDVVNRFKRLSNVKIVMALRQDLLYKVLHVGPTAGFQEEKFKSLYLNLTWDKKELQEIIRKRVSKLIERHYTKEPVKFEDVFTARIDGKDTFDYMLERTFMRPRDIIVFMNDCLDLCAGRPKISASIIKDAENNYSAERLQSLAHEWVLILPDLIHTSGLLFGMKQHFEVSVLSADYVHSRFEEIALSLCSESSDPVTRQLFSLYSDKGANFETVRNYVLREFYAVGLVGIKSGPTDPVSWAKDITSARIGSGQVRASSSIYIHPMFHRALGTRI